MEIVKFEKICKNKYKLIFKDNDSIELYDDVIVKYNLVSNKKIDDELFKKVIEYNGVIDCFYLSIKYLKKRLRTESEMRKFLKEKVSSNIIDEVMTKLKKDGYINDFLFLKSYIHDKYYLSKYGDVKIFNDLTEYGFLKDYINCNLTIYDWKKKIRVLALKKMKLNNKDSDYMLKVKTKKYLIELGFNNDTINNVFETFSFPNRELDALKYSISKYKKKYLLKYDESEVKNRVIDSLYKKGFKLEDIKRYYDENEV